jgi:iron complex outermembrane receptor protein
MLGEVDVIRNITAFAGFGYNQRINRVALSIRQIIDEQGTLAASDADLWGSKIDTLTFDGGLRGDFDTGPVHHQTVAGYTQYENKVRFAYASSPIPASNLYHPVFGQKLVSIPDPDDGPKIFARKYSSGVLADTFSILNKRVQLTAGVRFQQIEQTVGGSYDESANTPMAGLVIKPWQHVSLYGNYSEALEQGAVAPLTAANAGEVFPPFVSEGYEAGSKIDFGRVLATLAVFQLTRPSAFLDPETNVFGVDGEQRNRGVEFSVFGEVINGVRLLGGTSYIDATLTKTEGGVNDGNEATVPYFQLAFSGEWDVPFLRSLTLWSRVTHASWQYQNRENTRKIPGWTQWDLGARYTLSRSNGNPITIRASLDNVLDSNAWYGSSRGTLHQRAPQTFLLSASIGF